MATKSWWNYRPKGVIFPWVQRSVPHSELSSGIYINQLSIPGEPSVLANYRGTALDEWTTNSATRSCDSAQSRPIDSSSQMQKESLLKFGHVFRIAMVENRTVFPLTLMSDETQLL
jgi:hypothetical protein